MTAVQPKHFVQRLGAVAVLLLSLSIASENAFAQEQSCPRDNPLRSTGTLNLRIDNDMFGGVGQDRGYTNGFLVSWVSPNLIDYIDDPCLPRLVRGLNRFLEVLQPEGFDEQNMTIGFGQMMYTPTDKTRSDLIGSCPGKWCRKSLSSSSVLPLGLLPTLRPAPAPPAA